MQTLLHQWLLASSYLPAPYPLVGWIVIFYITEWQKVFSSLQNRTYPAWSLSNIPGSPKDQTGHNYCKLIISSLLTGPDYWNGRFQAYAPFMIYMFGVCHNRTSLQTFYCTILMWFYDSVILASLHVCVPSETSLQQWEKMEHCLQHCFSAYGIGHVTISPEIHRDDQSISQSKEESGGCQLPTRDDFGCSVSDLRKRRIGV